MVSTKRSSILTSPQLIGSYLGGFSGLVHVGMTPSTQLKFRPDYISFEKTVKHERTYQRRKALTLSRQVHGCTPYALYS
jgi:hypothetical protein